jgi:single-stranded DNA-binding protein
MNVFVGIGHISKAAATRTVNVKGVPTLVTDFTLAVNEGFGDTQSTDFIRCSIWRDRGAKMAPHLTVGRSVTVKGRITCQAWIGSQGDNAGKPMAQLVMTNPAVEFNTAGAKAEPEDAPFEYDEADAE